MRHRVGIYATAWSAVLRQGILFCLWATLVALGPLCLLGLVGPAWAAQSRVEAESMTLSGWRVYAKDNLAASGGKEVAFATNGSASAGFDGTPTSVTLRARGKTCQEAPRLKVYVDGVLEGRIAPTGGSFADYTVALSDLSEGSHALRISFENDYYDPLTCDRNAYLDYYEIGDGTVPPTGGGTDPVLVGAAKIGNCNWTGDEQTGKLLDAIPGTVFTAGDNAYDDGTPANFEECYEPSWGRHKARTRPTPGNHDYFTPGASGYFGYFGAAAGDPAKGYYSYDLGGWHVIALNSLCGQVGGCEATSPMGTWLRQDLAANPKACTVAYFNHALFSSGRHGNDAQVRPIWEALYTADADVVVSGRDHDYERFAPQRPDGTMDASRGIREFVVGTGGAGLFDFDLGTPKPNSEAQNDDTYGVLKLTLHPTNYDWEFVPVAGKTYSDSGTGNCH
jgi:hypothetical protein